MILIDTSDTLVDLLPEVYAHLEPDTPLDLELPLAVRSFLKTLLLRAFRQALTPEPIPDLRWVLVLKADPALQCLTFMRWSDVEVIDIHGTFLLTIEE